MGPNSRPFRSFDFPNGIPARRLNEVGYATNRLTPRLLPLASITQMPGLSAIREKEAPSRATTKIAKCSQDTALRDIDDLVRHGVLVKGEAGGRSTNYLLVENLVR